MTRSSGHGYHILLSWNAADAVYLAEVPELPGCVADGATQQDALNQAERVIREWIETAQALGRPIPTPKHRWH